MSQLFNLLDVFTYPCSTLYGNILKLGSNEYKLNFNFVNNLKKYFEFVQYNLDSDVFENFNKIFFAYIKHPIIFINQRYIEPEYVYYFGKINLNKSLNQLCNVYLVIIDGELDLLGFDSQTNTMYTYEQIKPQLDIIYQNESFTDVIAYFQPFVDSVVNVYFPIKNDKIIKINYLHFAEVCLGSRHFNPIIYKNHYLFHWILQ